MVAWLEFAGDAEPADLRLAWSRANETESAPRPVAGPTLTWFAPPGPNPANATTRIRPELAVADAGVPAVMRVYDLAGRLVRRIETAPLAAGAHDLTWNLADEQGRRVPAGVYLARLSAGRHQAVHRLVVVR